MPPFTETCSGAPTDNTNKTQLFKLWRYLMPQVKYSSSHTTRLQTTKSQCSKIPHFVRDSILSLFRTTLQYGFSIPSRPPVFHIKFIPNCKHVLTLQHPFLEIPSSLFSLSQHFAFPGPGLRGLPETLQPGRLPHFQAAHTRIIQPGYPEIPCFTLLLNYFALCLLI